MVGFLCIWASPGLSSFLIIRPRMRMIGVTAGIVMMSTVIGTEMMSTVIGTEMMSTVIGTVMMNTEMMSTVIDQHAPLSAQKGRGGPVKRENRSRLAEV